MLRGLTTISYFADDVAAAADWYAALLGAEPYFRRPGPDGGLGYVEFRVGDHQHELGLISSRFAAHRTTGGPAGAVMYWHVDDVPAALARLLDMGAKEHEAPVDRGAGFVTATVIDPFGNILGIMYNPHYLEMTRAGGAEATP